MLTLIKGITDVNETPRNPRFLGWAALGPAATAQLTAAHNAYDIKFMKEKIKKVENLEHTVEDLAELVSQTFSSVSCHLVAYTYTPSYFIEICSQSGSFYKGCQLENK